MFLEIVAERYLKFTHVCDYKSEESLLRKMSSHFRVIVKLEMARTRMILLKIILMIQTMTARTMILLKNSGWAKITKENCYYYELTNVNQKFHG